MQLKRQSLIFNALTQLNPRTGVPGLNRIFSADGTRAIRLGTHEMSSLGTPKGHFHMETWTDDAVNDLFHVTNTLQKITPGGGVIL